ncbi:MAG: low molecular weight protein-tyrosine-phosphatase [Pseudomonadota bacterium]
MSHRILFVCLGNICRSPSAEGVFRAIMPDAITDSAGTSDWHIGNPPYEPMQQAARRRGYDLSELRARQFVPGDFEAFDLILGMDTKNLAAIEALRPSGNATQVRLLTDFAPQSDADHVPDPYHTRDFDGALDLIEVAAQGLRTHLNSAN